MGNLTRVKINEYYDQFKPVSVTFSKEVIGVTGLMPRMVNLKCGSDFFPCVIFSTSFETAKVVANNKSGLIDRLSAANNVVSLRYCFRVPSSDEQLAFLVPTHVTEKAPYGGSEDMTIFTLQYSQRPPDDLIEIMGRVLEANYHYSKNKERFFSISPDTVRRMALANKDVVNFSLDGTMYVGVLRQLAFGAVRCITKGLPKEATGKQAVLRFDFEDPREVCSVESVIDKYEAAMNHPDTAVVTFTLTEPVSMNYKVRLCDYVTTLRLSSSKSVVQTGTAENGGSDIIEAANEKSGPEA